MLFALLIILYLLIVLIELPPLIKGKMYREIGVFTAFYLLGIYMSLMQFYNLSLYNPFVPLIKLVSGS